MAFDFSVTGNTKLDTSGFTQGISGMTVAAGNLIADLVKTASSQLSSLAQNAVQTGSAYETSLAKVGTIADSSKLSTQMLSSQITAMSNTMGIAATDIAEATYQAISAGQDTSNAVAFAGQSAKLAAAGFTSTTSAVDILTTTLNAYGLSADQATHVSDVLLTTQNLGKTSVDELSSSMGKVIPLAAAYNVSVENLSSGLAVMTANGIATAEATTYTKSMLNELGDAGSTVGKILQQQTGQSFAQLNAEGKSLGDVLQFLYDSVGGNSTAFAGLWSSVEAGTGALSLASGGADKFNSVLAQMVDSAGATETAYETMTGTFQHSMESLQTTAENLAISLFDAMEPSLKEAANWGTDCLNALTNALHDGGPSAMLDAASGILENLTAGIVQKIPGLASTATQVITQLVEYLADHQDAIFDAGIQLLEQLIIGITDNLPALITAGAGLIAKFSAALIAHLPDILSCGAALLTTLVDGIIRSVENLGEAALACIGKLLGVWDGSMDEWGHIGENIVNGLLNGITGMWDSLVSSVKGKVTGMVDTVKGVLGIHSPSKVFDEIGVNTCLGLAQGLAKGNDKVKDAAKTVVASVTDTATQISDGVTTVTETVTETMADGSTQQKQVITETSKQIVNGVEKTVKTVTTRAADGAETVTQTMEDVKATVVSTTKDTQTQLVDGAKVTVEKTTQLLADGSEQISTITTRTGTEIIDGVERTVKTVTTKAADGTETTVRTIEDAGPQYASAGALLTAQLSTALDDGWAKIKSDVQTNALGAIKSLATALKNGDLESLGLWAASYFWHACTEKQREQIQDLALGALNQLSSALSGVGNNLAALASSLVAKFVPAATAATTGQTALNVAMDANPIMLVISLIGMLVGALVSFAGTNKDVASGFQRVWQGVEDVISVVFESMLRFLGLSIQGFVSAINVLIDSYNKVAKFAGLSTISRVTNPIWDQADKIAAKRKESQAQRKAATESKAAQTALDTQYAQDSGAAEKKQLEAEYAKKVAELAKAKLSSDNPGMLDAEKNVAAADYAKSLADLEKSLLDARYKKATAELSKRTETDAAALAELEKQITEADNTLKSGDLEKELLRVNYEKTLKELENKYNKTSSTGSTGTGSSSASSTNSKKVIASTTDTRKTTNADGSTTTTKVLTETLQDAAGVITQQVTTTVTEAGKRLMDGVERSYKTITTYIDGVQQKTDTYFDDLEQNTSPAEPSDPTPEPSTPTLPDNTGAIEDNTAAILAANEKLAEMVRQADSLVLSDNMAVTRSVAASGTAQIAAAANNYHREGDTTIIQNINSKAQTAADLQREARWEADRAKATKR